jgi:hypothetical protein
MILSRECSINDSGFDHKFLSMSEPLVDWLRVSNFWGCFYISVCNVYFCISVTGGRIQKELPDLLVTTGTL